MARNLGQQALSNVAELHTVPWNYGDATRAVFFAAQPTYLFKITLIVEIPLSGPNPELELRIQGGAILIPRAVADLRSECAFELFFGLNLAMGTVLELSIFPGSSVIGSGKILLEVA